ncbi:hypothetical protein ACFW1J_03640 [Priestia aryabhattai]|uniref:hypothetical protein n=1 Tax=Priestia aryabhattai TaxID=412384 RepID=UPI001C8D34C5|nr:hypothetical protein [Priestia aryabhattai]MBX9966825.1 hypothetical protein [Priestia aryabhattai]
MYFNIIELIPKDTEQLRARIRNGLNSRKTLIPSLSENINKMIEVPITPERTYSRSSIKALYCFVSFIIESIIRENGILNTKTNGTTINPLTNRAVKSLKSIYPLSKNKIEKTKLPQMDEIIAGIILVFINVVSQ